MTDLFNHIRENGVQTPHFNTGTMCLIYKKGDKTHIANYRPITLLNTDYKIMSKTIALRLAHVAHDLIHPNQQGFIPGRSLYDATQLSRMMIDYCKIYKENGLIVALDQEKAYDLIAHDYLWQVLEHLNFSMSFIEMIQKLYTNANTHVMVNGTIPDLIKIK